MSDKEKERRAVGYLRVSTDAQAKEGHYGLDDQKADIIAYCAKNGITIAHWVVDKGKSGAKERESLDKIIDAKDKDYKIIIVAKNDRIARDVELYFYYEFRLKRAGLQLICVAEDSFLSGMSGAMRKLYESIIASFAEFERERITQRMTGGRRRKAEEGGYAGGRPPLGYKSEEGHLVIDTNEVVTIKSIFAMYENGLSGQKIADALNTMGVTTKDGKPFHRNTILQIERNQMFYRGYYHYGNGKKWMKGEQEPILEDREYKKGNNIAKG